MSKSYFTPLTSSQPLSYAYDRKQFYRNVARENKWGAPVYFVPSTNAYDVTGQAGPGYLYGHSYNVNQGMYGNCTWWAMGRNYEVNGDPLIECIGDAYDAYRKFSGSKDGGSLTSGEYFGDTINAGDILVFGTKLDKPQPGHVVFVEKVDGDILTISESGYSKNSVYKDMACVVYTLNRKNFKCGNAVSLRPQSPYTEYAYGVLHTGKDAIPWDKPEPVEEDTSKNQLYIGEVNLNIRDAGAITGNVLGVFNKPCAYFNVVGINQGPDYTWYNLGNDSWVADCDVEISYYEKVDKKKQEKTIAALQAELDAKNKQIEELKAHIEAMSKIIN